MLSARQATADTDGALVAENTGHAKSSDANARSFLIDSPDATERVFIGPAGVTTGGEDRGFPVSPELWPLEITLEPGESLHAIVEAGEQVLEVLEAGRVGT